MEEIDEGSADNLTRIARVLLIAGQDRFQKLTRAYFSKARGVVIVCDVSREGTIDAVTKWKEEIDTWCEQSDQKDLPVVLFANKADLLTDPQDAFRTGALREKVCRESNILGEGVCVIS